jgi:hypothetical protein
MAQRIDSLRQGAQVNLRVHSSSVNEGYDTVAFFTGIVGEGDDRRAGFSYTNGGGSDFEAYRFNGRWAVSSDARRVTLI